MQNNPYESINNALLKELTKLNKRTNSRNKKSKTITRQSTKKLSGKENLEGSYNFQSNFNLSGNCLSDKTNIQPLVFDNNSSIENLVVQESSVKGKGSPWEGNNPLVWCRSTDSMISKIDSQRKRAFALAQDNPNLQSRNTYVLIEGTFSRKPPVDLYIYYSLHWRS